MNSQTFGEKIRNERKKNGLSIKKLSQLIDYNEKSLSKVERDLLIAPERIIKPLSKALNLSYKELIIKYLYERILTEVRDFEYAKIAIEGVLKRLEKGERGTREIKKRNDIFNEIKKYFKSKPIEKAWVFGSFAKKTESSGSDIDILVRFKKPNNITLLDLIEMKSELEDKTGRDVDLVEEGQARENIQKEINKEKILIYGR